MYSPYPFGHADNIFTAPTAVPGMHVTDVHAAYLPGLIIFVHGVNSDGEWYEAAEQGLIAGLNKRMGYDLAHQADRCMLRPASYAAELHANGKMNREVSGKRFLVDSGRSPIIRFRWGYKAAGKDGTDTESIDELEHYKGKIYLNELDAWGGGPFQNGTSALPYMWGLGLDDRVFWWLYANMFPVDGREVYACPPRAYYAHAAHRLKELIKAIRQKQPDCPVTVVCHSQGNMVTLGAALLGEREDAIADTYVLCNPPYSLESLGMDKIVNHDTYGVDAKNGVGQFGSVTTLARQTTFKNFLDAVRKRAGMGQPISEINEKQGFIDPESGETRFKLDAFPASPSEAPKPGFDRDNRGHTFLYCNPHDQVIGVSPVQGIGWKGISREQLGSIGADGVLHQRVWAQPGGAQATPFRVGCPNWTGKEYRYLADNHDPKQFWHPRPPMMRYALSLNPDQSIGSKIITLATAFPIWLITHLFDFPINDPPKDHDDPKRPWAVPITAPVLPEPVTPQSSRYGKLANFDEGKDPAKDALAREEESQKLNDEAHGGAYKVAGLGDVQTEAQLRYEHEARLRAARARKAVQSEADERQAVKRMLEENPNATDHSTILTNPMHAEKVLAYDVAVGWVNPSRITPEDLYEFRKFANWMLLEQYKLDIGLKEQFKEYWDKGFFNGHQIQRTYTMEHMAANAPKIIDARERSPFGYIK